MSPDRRRAGQPAWAYEMEISLKQEIQAVKDAVPDEDRIRLLAREEMGLATRASWGARSAVAAVVMLSVSVSTFLLTLLKGTGHA